MSIVREEAISHLHPAGRNGSSAACPHVNPPHPYKHDDSGMSPDCQAAVSTFAFSGTLKIMPACPSRRGPSALQPIGHVGWSAPCRPFLFLPYPPPLPLTATRPTAIALPKGPWPVALPLPNLSCDSTTRFPYGSVQSLFLRTL